MSEPLSTYSKKAIGVAVTLIVTALLTSSGATLKYVYDGAQIASDNKAELHRRKLSEEKQDSAISLLTQNQRLIICEMKAKKGEACNPTDLLITPTGE